MWNIDSLKAYAEQIANQYGIDSEVFKAQIKYESGWNPNALSAKGAMGISQFIPSTAEEYGIDPYNPIQSIEAQGKYMSSLLRMFQGDYRKALAGYNWGQGNVKKYGMDKLPQETIDYIDSILGTKTVSSEYSSGAVLKPGESVKFIL